jgi:hypothetical protein
MSQWWQENNSFFAKEKEYVFHKYPSLTYSIENKIVKLSGELPIVEIDDSYSIEIEFPEAYPNKIPIVKEVGGDIPRELDLHISYDGSCCLCLPQLEKFYFPKGSNIIIFLEKLVIPFFANQAYFKITGTWINGEYSHGKLGVYEFYKNLLDVHSLTNIIKFLKLSIKSYPNFNKKCICGSNKPFKRCHLPKLNFLKKFVPAQTIEEDVKTFERLLKKEI